MNDAALEMARLLTETLASRDQSAFDPESANSRLLALSDRLLAAAPSEESATQSMVEALAWTQRPIPEEYPAAIAGFGDPSYDPAWDQGRFLGFGYAFMSSYLHLDHQLKDEARYQAVLDRLDRPTILLRIVSGGQALVEDEYSGALAYQAARVQRVDAGLAHQFQAGFSSLDIVREEWEARALSWERQIQGWTALRGESEAWRDAVVTTTSHLSSILGFFDCVFCPGVLPLSSQVP